MHIRVIRRAINPLLIERTILLNQPRNVVVKGRELRIEGRK